MKIPYADSSEDIDSENLTQEEQDALLREDAADFLEGIIAAANDIATESKEVIISRNGKKYFKIIIKPVPESKAKELKRKCTDYKRNRAYGIKVPGETDTSMYRSRLIYEATVNKNDTWDNKKLWKSLESVFPVVTGWQTVDLVLLAGEKDRMIDEIDELSGYTMEEEEKTEENIKN